MKLIVARARAHELAHLHAFISLTGEDGDGPVVAVKDNIDVRGAVTTAGSTLLPNLVATEDAQVIGEIRRHGCVVIGKTNMHEWACGASSANPHYGSVVNPVDPGRIPGGSSGGSAVAVAASMCDWAIGTDTGGSIRVPASFCGVVGFKPTLHCVSTDGVVPVSQTMDTVGPLAANVTTVANAFAMMTGCRKPAQQWRTCTAPIRLVVPFSWIEDLDAETAEVWDEISNGWPVVELPELRFMTKVQQLIVRAEAANYHKGWMESSSDQYGSDVLDFLRQGVQIRATEYIEALQARDRLQIEVEAALQGYDALLLPTTPSVAPEHRKPETELLGPVNKFTRPFNVTGHPAISVPVLKNHLPIGMQLVGHWGRDVELLSVALRFEARCLKGRDPRGG